MQSVIDALTSRVLSAIATVKNLTVGAGGVVNPVTLDTSKLEQAVSDLESALAAFGHVATSVNNPAPTSSPQISPNFR